MPSGSIDAKENHFDDPLPFLEGSCSTALFQNNERSRCKTTPLMMLSLNIVETTQMEMLPMKHVYKVDLGSIRYLSKASFKVDLHRQGA